MKALARVIERPMDNKDLLMKAIDNYDLLAPSYRTVFKALIDLAIDDIVIINVIKLSKISKVSRPMVYNALSILEENQFIERSKKPKTTLSVFSLRMNKINEIIKYYNVQLAVEKKYLQ